MSLHHSELEQYTVGAVPNREMTSAGRTGSITVAQHNTDGEPIPKQHCSRNELKMCKMEIWDPSLLLVPITSYRWELHAFCNSPATFLRGKNSRILRDFPIFKDFPVTLLCPDLFLEPLSAEH